MHLSSRMILIMFLGVLCGAAGDSGRFASGPAYAHYLQARLAEGRGDLRLAVEELRSALVFDESSPQLHLELAKVLSHLAQLALAEAEAHRALEGDPQGRIGARSLTLLGKIHIAQRQNDPAIEDLQRAIQMEIALAKERAGEADDEAEVDPEPWRILAELYLEAGDEPGAARTFEDLEDRVPSARGGLRQMGKMYLERRDQVRAEKYLRRALERNPKDPEAWRSLAALEESRGRHAEARRNYQEVLAIDGEDLDALLALGKLELAANDPVSANTHFTRMIRASPEEVSARLSVALAWVGARRPTEALAVVDEGLRSGPANPRLLYVRGVVLEEQRRWIEAAQAYGAVEGDDRELWLNARRSQAYCLARAGRYAQALRALEKPIAAQPRNARLIARKAYVLRRAGRFTEATRLLRKALKEREGDQTDPDGTSELHESLASNLARSGRSAEAVAVLQRALAERPRDTTLLYALGAAYEQAGNHQSAVAQMKALLVVDPEYAEALNFVGYCYADRGVHLDEAEELIGKALELRPENGSFLDSQGWLYFQKGDYARALLALQKADSRSGPEPTILEHLGDTYRALHRFSEAAAAYQRALRCLDEGDEPERPDQRQVIGRKLREVRAAKSPVPK